jgi:hypothetical protein
MSGSTEISDQVRQAVKQLLEDNLALLAANDVPRRFLGDRTVAHTVLGPAAAHAALWSLTKDLTHRSAALELVERFLLARGVPKAAGSTRNRLRLAPARRYWKLREAIEAGSTLGWIGRLVGGDDGRQIDAVVLAAFEVVVHDGGLRFYINGNYAIPQCELAWFAGSHEGYEQAWRLLVSPHAVSRRWRGYGWIAESPGGYFTETPGWKRRRQAATFDLEYTQLQVDRMVRLWLATNNPRALSYLRFLHARVWALVDRQTWMLDARGGSRRDHMVPFYSAGTAVLAALGEIAPEDALEQVARGVVAAYRTDPGTPDAYRMRGYGLTLLSLLHLDRQAPGDRLGDRP